MWSSSAQFLTTPKTQWSSSVRGWRSVCWNPTNSCLCSTRSKASEATVLWGWGALFGWKLTTGLLVSHLGPWTFAQSRPCWTQHRCHHVCSGFNIHILGYFYFAFCECQRWNLMVNLQVCPYHFSLHFLLQQCSTPLANPFIVRWDLPPSPGSFVIIPPMMAIPIPQSRVWWGLPPVRGSPLRSRTTMP